MNHIKIGQNESRDQEYRGGELKQGILFACMRMSQWDPTVQLMYTNKEKENSGDRLLVAQQRKGTQHYWNSHLKI
jgi:hypothetical protein